MQNIDIIKRSENDLAAQQRMLLNPIFRQEPGRPAPPPAMPR
jgi:hypothetical protein